MRSTNKQKSAAAAFETVAAFCWFLLLLTLVMLVAATLGCVAVDKRVTVYTSGPGPVIVTVTNESESTTDAVANAVVELLP